MIDKKAIEPHVPIWEKSWAQRRHVLPIRVRVAWTGQRVPLSGQQPSGFLGGSNLWTRGKRYSAVGRAWRWPDHWGLRGFAADRDRVYGWPDRLYAGDIAALGAATECARCWRDGQRPKSATGSRGAGTRGTLRQANEILRKDSRRRPRAVQP